MPITSTILDVAGSHPAHLALVGADESLTYSELLEDSRTMFAVVDELHRAQSAPPAPAPETEGIPITAISATSAFHTSRIIAGLAGYRAVSATIDPRWPLAHQLGVIRTTGVGVVISDSSALAEALAASTWTGTVISLADFQTRESALAADAAVGAVGTSAHLAPTVRDASEPFLMLFSSGTTSNPKAFIKTRQQYRDNVAVSAAHLEPLPGVATLAPGPVSYSLTLYAVIESLATGGSVHVADEFDPITMGRRIDAEAITRVVAVPAVVRALAEAARRDPERFTGLDLVVTGGANLPESIRDRLGEILPSTRLISYYGAAEIGFIGDSREGDGTWITIYPTIGAQIRSDVPRSGSAESAETSATTATSTVSAAGERESGAELPEGELGALWIRAAACSYGYVTDTTDVVLRGADGWATVDDQGRIVNGMLQLAGRAGDIAITGGHKVSLPEVERAFESYDNLGEVCAIALDDPALGSIIVLVIEADADNADIADNAGNADIAGKAALLNHVRARLAPQFVPRRIYRLDRLPRTVGGKVRRAETVDLIMDGQGQRL